MSPLEMQGCLVNIDFFQLKKVDESKIFLLTHAHTDHCLIPKKFPVKIYCTQITAQLMKSQQQEHLDFILEGSLVFFQWNRIQNLDVYCFPSNHCFGSCGFFIPNENNLLFWGDGRPSRKTINRMRKDTVTDKKKFIVGDSFLSTKFASLNLQYLPSIQHSCKLLHELLHFYASKRKIWIRLSHIGALACLPKDSDYYYQYHCCGSVLADEICQKSFDLFVNKNNKNQKDAKKNSKKIIIHVSRHWPHNCTLEVDQNYLVIVLSCNWWLVNKIACLYHPFAVTKDIIRVFLCRHASASENALLKQI